MAEIIQAEAQRSRHSVAGQLPGGRTGRVGQRRRLPIVVLAVGLVVTVSLTITQLSVVYLARIQPLRLAPGDLYTLATLRDTQLPRLLSAVSPDDTTVVTASIPENGRGGSDPGIPSWAFLDIRDGTSKAIDKAVRAAEPQSEVAWRDDRTAVYLSANKAGMPLLVRLDRATGTVISSTLRLPGRPLSLAPNASRVLVEIGGGGGATLAAVDLAGESVTRLVSYAGGGPSSIAWTPDGAKLALVRSDVPAGLAANQQAGIDLAVQDALGELPPAQNPFLQGNVVDVFDLARRELRPAALRAADGNGDLFKSVQWNTDGSTLLAQMARPGRIAGRAHPIYRHPERAYLRFYDATLKLVGTLERPETEAVLSSSARFVSPDELVIVAPAGMTFQLHYYRRSTGELRTLPIGEGSFAEALDGYQVLPTNRSRRLIFNHSSFLRPPELYRIGLDGEDLKALTRLNVHAAAANRIRVDKVAFALKSGVTREGYLLQPAGAAFPPRNARLVLYQQGGPAGPMANRWGTAADEPFNLLPNFGIGLLVMTFPGREGFGPEHFNALKEGRGFGQLDIDEAAEVVEYMIGQGYTSRDRVGITGGSYGGYFASQSIVRHPELYAAAVALYSMLDLSQAWEFNVDARPEVSYWEGRVPASDPAEYAGDSPIAQAGRIRTPLLLIHGAKDELPLSIVTSFRDKVAATGTPTELISFKEEGHGLSSPSSHMAAAQAQIRWFQEYLAPGGRSEGGR